MVLFYCTFVALKARNLLTVQVHPNEFKLRREKRLFQAYVYSPAQGVELCTCLQGLTGKRTSQIVDDGFKHSLIVYEDMQTRGLRLHAAVWEGELRQCPVWTAFGKRPLCPSPRQASALLLSWILTGAGCFSHTSVPVPDMAQPPLTTPGLAQGRPALCVLQHLSTGKHAAEQIRRIRDLL
jgi:hypothetical protein